MCADAQALLKAESKLRSQETEASLLEETAIDLNTAAAADEAVSTRRADEKHDREVAAARRQLALTAAHQQHEQQRAAAEEMAAEQRNRYGQEEELAAFRIEHHSSLQPQQLVQQSRQVADASQLAGGKCARSKLLKKSCHSM